jgi:phosphotransferase system enzyme I (PtsI)
VFDQIEDEYLRERRSDVEFVVRARPAESPGSSELGPLSPPPDAIVVAYDLSPADTAQLHKAAVAGLITDAGGKTSHTAIIARAHEIPAVVGLETITEVVETDDLLIVDGAAGMVIVNPSPATVGRVPRRAAPPGRGRGAAPRATATCRRAPATGVDIQLYANIDNPDEIDGALEHGAVGIGLTRTEFLFMVGDRIPDEEIHYRERDRRCSIG